MSTRESLSVVNAMPSHNQLTHSVYTSHEDYEERQYVVNDGSSNRDVLLPLQQQQQQNHVMYQQQPHLLQAYPDYEVVQPGMYATVSNEMYYESPSNSHVISNGGEMFIVEEKALVDDLSPSSLPSTIRAAPASVQWLRDNYEQTEGVSLPRSSLYINYQAHCEQCNLDPMNPASFGKLIRSIFPGLRTRRLGTRGHSQYHYYGIRIKPTSSLRDFDDRYVPMRTHPSPASTFSLGSHHQRFLLRRGLKMEHLRHRRQHHPSMPPHHQNISDEMDSTNDSMAEGNNNSSCNNTNHSSCNNTNHSSCNNSATNLTQNNQDFLGAVPDRATHFEPLDIQLEDLPDGCTLDNISTFVSLFKNHCKYFMKLVSKLQFSKIEALWISFWKNLKQDENDNDGDMPTGDKSKCQLSKEMFYSICQLRQIQQFIRHAEHILYQAVVHVLLPDVLKPIPCSLTQSIRNFAKHMEGWMKNALSSVPQEILNIKMQAACALAQILRRYTSLNHLAQAARAVLLNQVQTNQMLADINRIDFDNVQDQASGVCHCGDATITDLLADFKLVLQQQAALEDWSSWLKDVVDRFLGSTATLNSSDFSSSADQFLLKWSYYSSLIIRDLTLRSAASFGSFHLINLLFNEYMYYLVEHKVAESFGHTCIAGMCQHKERTPTLNVSSASYNSKHDDKRYSNLIDKQVNSSAETAVRIADNDNDNQDKDDDANDAYLVSSSSNKNDNRGADIEHKNENSRIIKTISTDKLFNGPTGDVTNVGCNARSSNLNDNSASANSNKNNDNKADSNDTNSNNNNTCNGKLNARSTNCAVSFTASNSCINNNYGFVKKDGIFNGSNKIRIITMPSSSSLSSPSPSSLSSSPSSGKVLIVERVTTVQPTNSSSSSSSALSSSASSSTRLRLTTSFSSKPIITLPTISLAPLPIGYKRVELSVPTQQHSNDAPARPKFTIVQPLSTSSTLSSSSSSNSSKTIILKPVTTTSLSTSMSSSTSSSSFSSSPSLAMAAKVSNPATVVSCTKKPRYE